jgi:hypothetical protein
MIIISRIQDLKDYIVQNSRFSEETVSNVIKALGFPKKGGGEPFKELSNQLENCALHGSNIGFHGFIYTSDTVAFFKNNRKDIASHMEETAEEMGTDIFSMVQSFGAFRNSEKPAAGEIGKALWDSQASPDFFYLYEVFAQYALEEVSNAWLRYLEDHPFYRAELSA